MLTVMKCLEADARTGEPKTCQGKAEGQYYCRCLKLAFEWYHTCSVCWGVGCDPVHVMLRGGHRLSKLSSREPKQNLQQLKPARKS